MNLRDMVDCIHTEIYAGGPGSGPHPGYDIKPASHPYGPNHVFNTGNKAEAFDIYHKGEHVGTVHNGETPSYKHSGKLISRTTYTNKWSSRNNAGQHNQSARLGNPGEFAHKAEHSTKNAAIADVVRLHKAKLGISE